MSFFKAYRIIRANEGVLVTRADAALWGDPGGKTFCGVTEVTLRRLGIGRDPASLNESEVQGIYRLHYWEPVERLDHVGAGLSLAVFDYGVQSGPGRAIKSLQSIVGANPDGICGPLTTRLTSRCGVLKALGLLSAERRDFLVRWVLRKPRRMKLLRGLIARVDLVERIAVRWSIEERPTQPADVLWRGHHVPQP